MASEKLAGVPEVDIDPDGTFKYVLIKVYGAKKGSDSEEVKTVVRGFSWGAYHGENFFTIIMCKIERFHSIQFLY
ncbi:14 kDa phosphohistidine phosphatase [Blattella germanica]|nr:14 kDa phosphohistidine phosphatase [Blattella germanica]